MRNENFTQTDFNRAKYRSREGAIFASVVMWWFFAIVFGTLTGVWIKLFWIGWVLAK